MSQMWNQWSTQLVKSNFGYQSTDAKSQPVCIETNSITCVHVWQYPFIWDKSLPRRKGWEKYPDLSVASRWLRQIIDLWYTDKSWYFAITEFKCVFPFDHRVCFLMNIFGKRSDLPFSRKSDRKKEKCTVSFTHEENVICSQFTHQDEIAREQTIICRQ